MPPKKKGKKDDAEEAKKREEEEAAKLAAQATAAEEAALLAAEEASRRKMEAGEWCDTRYSSDIVIGYHMGDIGHHATLLMSGPDAEPQPHEHHHRGV